MNRIATFALAFLAVALLSSSGPSPAASVEAKPMLKKQVWNGQSDGIWISEYSAFTVHWTESALGPYLRSGDGIAVVLANTTNMSRMNSLGWSLHRNFTNVTLRGYTSLDGGTGSVRGLAATIGNISSVYTQLSADWEKNGPLGFQPNGTVGVRYFQNFSQIVRATGRAAIGYPSGRGVLGRYGYPPANWNYSDFAAVLDGMTIETQGYCSGNLSSWIPAVQKILSEYNASHRNTSTLSLQISLGVAWNGVNATDALACARYWRGIVHGNVFLWWGPSQETALIRVLKGLGR